MDFIQRILESITRLKLTPRDFIEIFFLSAIAVCLYLIYWGTKNPDTVIQVFSGERIIGNVGDCLLLELKQQNRTRYRLALNIEKKDNSDISIAAGSLQNWTGPMAIETCDRLVEIRNKIRQ